MTVIITIATTVYSQNVNLGSLSYNNNCFACVYNGHRYCMTTGFCASQSISYKCADNATYNSTTGCPIKNYCNGTGQHGVIWLHDLNQTNQTNSTSNNSSISPYNPYLYTKLNGSVTVNIPYNESCFLAIINQDRKNQTWRIRGANVSTEALTFRFPESTTRETNLTNFTITPYDNVKLLYLGTVINGIKTPPKVTLSWENPPDPPKVIQVDTSAQSNLRLSFGILFCISLLMHSLSMI
ncbi:UNKNOWN [Stylonychia lemnae]|uniref:Uncharacterized protein n=1 Tax=Stylonychia lemnae TaxID=5949 RepID=A0A078AAR8_STYLE|nr:UNKNOWN [Stylonychia lemnae]|eukprot:CDW79309.1 UNKNOWN [Stylonychia lemnae]